MLSSFKPVKPLADIEAFNGDDMLADNEISAQSAKPPRLLDQVRDAIRRKHYSPRTEDTYVHWIKRFIYFHDKRHPFEMGEAEVTTFLNHLARNRNVAASTQNQALSAILFLYRETLNRGLGWLESLERVRALHERDVAAGYGEVELPDALARKYPRAPCEWGWKFVLRKPPDPCGQAGGARRADSEARELPHAASFHLKSQSVISSSPGSEADASATS